ncbi:gprs (predicted) [Pycnogonum litorale]
MNAADYYGLDELRRACMGFVQRCINVDTVCALLASAEKYIQYKCTKSLVQKVLEYVDLHGNDVLSLGSFALLPQHVVRLILSREELRADELTKFQAAIHWSKKFCEKDKTSILRDVMGNFLEYIEFYKIPAGILMKEVHPLGLVPDKIIMTALAYQADPTSVDFDKLTSPNRFRRARSFSIVSQNVPQVEVEPTSSFFLTEWDSRTNSSESSHHSVSPRPYRRSDTIK